MIALEDMMLLLSRQDVVQACEMVDSEAVVREALVLHESGATTLPEEAYMSWNAPSGGRARTLNMPAEVAGGINAVGTKIINGNPANTRKGLPRASGLSLIFDRDTARIKGALEGAYISALRTALVSYLCAAELHCEQEMRLGVIGAGYIAERHLEVFLRRKSVGQVLIHDLDEARAIHLETLVRSQFPTVKTNVMASVEDTVRQSTCIITATTVTDAYIEWKWLTAGATIINVSLDDFTQEVYLKANKIFVDDWNLIINDSNRLLGKLYREGIFVGPAQPIVDGKKAIHGTIGALLLARVTGRERQDEIILVNPFGMAIFDVALSHFVFEFAKKLRLGSEFDFDR